MQAIRNHIRKAWRRLWFQNVVHALSWSLLLCFAVCFLGMLIPKLWFIPYTFPTWSRAWLATSAAAAIALSLLVAWLRRPTELNAAVELDRRFGLRERCSSAIALPEKDLDSAAGQALLEDAQSKLERIDVRDAFPVRPTPQLAWMMLPLAACIALFWVPDAESVAESKLAKTASENMVNVKNSTAPLLKAVQKKREEAESVGDLEAAEEFKKIEEQIRSLQNKTEVDQKKVIADLNELKKELQQKRDALGGADRMKKSMESLKDLDKGPAEKMAKALQDGDFSQAEKELEKMLDAMRAGELNADQSKQLQKQLEQMQKAMAEAQEKREQQRSEAQRELEKAEQEGNTEKIASLRKKLENLEQSDAQSSAMEKIQQQLAKADKALQEGDPKAAADALESMQDELSELIEDQQASDELEEMLEQLEDAKNASKCEQCKGAGCKSCNGTGNKPGQKGKGRNEAEGKGKGKGKGKGEGEGDGDGEGSGEGDRDESEADFKNYDAQVRDEMRKGETVNAGRAGGKNRKGTSRESAREAVLSSEPDQPDAIESIQLPKAQRDQLKEYFDSLRSGK